MDEKSMPTAEERQQWREDSTPPDVWQDRRILALLDALDAAERERKALVGSGRKQVLNLSLRATELQARAKKAEAALDRVRALADEWEVPVEGRQEYATLAFNCAADELRDAIDGGEDR